MKPDRLRIGAGLAALTFLVAPCALAQGFGILKMTTKLERTRPPEVYLLGTRIDVRADSDSALMGPLADQFETLLTSELLAHDKRLSVDRAAPETVLEVSLAALDTQQQWTEKKVTEYRKVGEKEVWNDKKKRYEVKDDYRNVEVLKRYLRVQGALSMSVRVVESEGGKVLHSQTVDQRYDREFLDANGAPIENELALSLMKGAVGEILPSVVPTPEVLEVQLAKGKLEDVGKLGQSGLWVRMLESLETMPPFKKPADEAYRFYDLGLASEALAYRAEDAAIARHLLEQAASHYGRAIDLKPEEKYFREPQVRIQTAIAQMGKSEEQKALYARTLEAKSKSLAGPGSETGSAAGQGAMTNQMVIELVRSGLDEANLADMIRDAQSVDFDLGPQATLHLLQGKVSNRIIAAMRARAKGVKAAGKGQ